MGIAVLQHFALTILAGSTFNYMFNRIGPKQWQNNQAPNKYKVHFHIRARIMMIRCQNHMELSDLTL